jgi:hypothetical protein
MVPAGEKAPLRPLFGIYQVTVLEKRGGLQETDRPRGRKRMLDMYVSQTYIKSSPLGKASEVRGIRGPNFLSYIVNETSSNGSLRFLTQFMDELLYGNFK